MKRLHLICNAHIDPIWQWGWDEGISSAIATFKSAADLADEFDYIFCHNEAMLYEAIEECDPELFERIKKLVKTGKWKITGGWYLQPDCNMPTGETLIRQISVGKEYFHEKFGTEPTVAYNFDSFGHSVGLPQILAKNGYVGYMTCRPNKTQFTYPGRFFKWVSPDGSSVIVTNSESYATFLGGAAKKIKDEVDGVAMWMLGSEDKKDDKKGMEDVDYSLWGVGNHGGGPSRKDLKDISDLKIDGVEIMHSTPESLFSDEINVLGEVNTSLVTCMPGCYSSMARVKRKFRETENLFYSVEKLLAAAELNGIVIDDGELKKAQKKILFSTFHDVLPGTCVEEGERDGLSALSYAERILRDYRTRAFLKLVMPQKKAGKGEFPVFIFNYAPYGVETPVEAEFTLENQNWDEKIRFIPHVFSCGEEIPCQTIKEESTLNLDWRKKVIFNAKLKPFGITRYDIKVMPEERKPLPVAQGCDLSRELSGFIPILEISDDTADPWGMSEKELKGIGENPVPFRMMTEREICDFCAVKKPFHAERIIEKGDIVTVYEGLYTDGKSNAAIQVRKYVGKPYTDLKIIAEFTEKNKLLSVRIPVPEEFAGCDCVGDGPFVFEKKGSGEIVFQKWVGKQNANGKIFAVINDGVYSGKNGDDFIRLSLIRGAGYCFHPIGDLPLYPEDRYLPRIDCGRYVFNLRLFIGNVEEVYREAELFNQPPYAVNVFPTGDKEVENKAVVLQGDVTLTNCHSGCNGEYIARIYNPAETTNDFTLKIGEMTVKGAAAKGEVVTVTVKGDKATVFHDSMPV